MYQVQNDGYAVFDHADEVIEHFFVGRGGACQDKKWLNANNIKRIVNAANDVPNFFDKDKTFCYQNLNISDSMSTRQLESIFSSAGKFALPALQARNNVLVHCSSKGDRCKAVAHKLMESKRPGVKLREQLQLGLLQFERKFSGTSSMNPDDFNSSRHSKKTGRRKGRRAYPSKLNTGTTGGWKVAIRERDGKKYYWNETTRQTSWTKPAGFREPVTDAPSASLKGIVPDTSAASLKGVVVKNKPTSLRGIVVNSPKHTKSESDSDDSDSDDSDSTETQDSSDETTKQSASPVALTPPLSPISIEDKNRRRTDSMRLLDVMEENENLRKMLEVKEQETQILRAELVSLRQDIERATGSQKHMQKTITEHEKTIARLRSRLASWSKSDGDDAATAKSKSKKQKFMSPIKKKDRKSANASPGLVIKSDQRDLSREIVSSKSHSLSPRGRDLLNPRDLSRNLSLARNPRDISRTRDISRNPRDVNVNLSRLRASSDMSASSSRSPRRMNSPQHIKPRVTQAQWTMQNKLGRSEKDYIDKLSSLVKILIRVKLSESKNQALQKKLLEELVGAHLKLYEDLRPMKQAKTQARFLDTLSGAFERHFLPLRKKYMEYALALDGAQNCCKEVGEAGPSLRRQRMEKLQELMDAPINQVGYHV